MTREEAVKYIRYCMCEGRLVGKTIPMIDEKWQAGSMAIKALEFAEWVAEEIFSDDWEYNKDSFEELACRKLEKMGIVRKTETDWVLVESEEVCTKVQ